MPRRGSLFWGIVAVLVAGTLVYGPAELARRSTGQGEPVDFLTHPQEGWRFVADALRQIGSARAGSPAAAGALAARALAGDRKSGVEGRRVVEGGGALASESAPAAINS